MELLVAPNSELPMAARYVTAFLFGQSLSLKEIAEGCKVDGGDLPCLCSKNAGLIKAASLSYWASLISHTWYL